MMKRLCDEIADMYVKKNKDYGDSFGQTHRAYGPVAGLTRITDKVNRLNALLLQYNKPNFESVIDTCKDLAAYALMLGMELMEDNTSSNIPGLKEGGAQ